MEWAERNKYSSFNSYKGLAYTSQYRQILDWMDRADYLPPPVECNLDPIAECNAHCYFCVTQRYLRDNRSEVGPMRMLSKDYMYRLTDFLADWGVKGLCISGGGEPTLHQAVPEILLHAHDRGMKTSLFTNGITLTDEMIDALWTCQFVTWSINANDAELFKRFEGVALFENAINSLKR